MGPPRPETKLTSSQRVWRVAVLLVWALVVGWVSVAPLLPFREICGFKVLTGWPCPFCGGTRCAAALLVGDLSGAWRQQAAFAPLFVVAALHSLVLIREAALARQWLSPRVWTWAWGVAGLVLLITWQLRLLAG